MVLSEVIYALCRLPGSPLSGLVLVVLVLSLELLEFADCALIVNVPIKAGISMAVIYLFAFMISGFLKFYIFDLCSSNRVPNIVSVDNTQTKKGEQKLVIQ